MKFSRSVACLFIIFASSFLFCSSLGTSDRKEGLVKNKFRIYVRIDTLDIPDSMTDAELDVLLIRKSADRFSKIWSTMCVNKNLTGDKEFYEAPIGAVDKGVLVYRSEKEEYAEAFVDFTIDKNNIEKYNSLSPLLEKNNGN